MNERIITKRLIFRELSMEDLNDFYKLENNDLVRKYIPNMNKTTYYECKDNLFRIIKNYNANTGIDTLAVTLKEDRTFIGITGFRYLEEIKNTEIGIRLLPEYWGNGYATETGKALINYAFYNLRLEEIIAMALPENERSMKSLENIGLDFIGFGYFRGSKVAYFGSNVYKRN